MVLKKEAYRFGSRGQVSFFIIIGIVILVAAGIFIYMVYQEPSEEALYEALEVVPTEFAPVNDYITRCLHDVAVEGFERIGLHGGYMSSDDVSISLNDFEPTDSDGFRIFPGDSQTAVPYWFYFESDNDCRQDCRCGTQRPPLYKEEGTGSVESQIAGYLEDSLRYCLRDFKPMEDIGYDISADAPEVEVMVRDYDISVALDMPVNIRKGDAEAELDRFYTAIPLNLKRIYELADGITDSQERYNYFERWTLDLMEAAAFGPDEEGLPPSFATTFDPGASPMYWTKYETEEKIRDFILTPNIPMFKVYQTANYRELSGVYQKTRLPIFSPTNTSYSDLAVDFFYLPLWPIYYDITGRGAEGGIIGPEQGFISYFSFLGLNRYTFYHDLSYPVVVDIYDQYALDGKGYHFLFGIEVNIRNNNPMNCTPEGETPFVPPGGSLMCKSQHRCSNASIVVRDDVTGAPVDAVKVLYGAGEESCVMGTTGYEDIAGERLAVYDMGLPQCVGGACTLSLVKYGYFSMPQTLAVLCSQSTLCGKDNILCDDEVIEMNITRQKPLDVFLKKKAMIKVADNTWEFRNEAKNLLPSESAVIFVKKIKESPYEEDLSASAMIDHGNPVGLFTPGLVPGDYVLSINLLYHLPDFAGRDKIVFEAVSREGQTLGPQEFDDVFPEGGAKFNITITEEDLGQGNVTFYALSLPDQANFGTLTFDDVGVMGDAMSKSEELRGALLPGFG